MKHLTSQEQEEEERAREQGLLACSVQGLFLDSHSMPYMHDQ